MANSAEVLREYLVSLGFRADPVQLNKFTSTIGAVDAKVMGLGKGLLSVASAAQAMVVGFTHAMEKAYYASKLGQSSVSNMQAAAFAGKQIGLTADQVQGAILNLSMALRKDPGIQALLESFGVKVEGRDMSDVLSDVVSQFRKMPFAIGSQFAEKFGLDPQTFFLLSEGLEKFNEAQKQRIALAKQAGVDEDAAAKASMEYKNALNEIVEKVELLGKKLTINLLPHFRALNDIVNKSLDFWIKWASGIDKVMEKVEGFYKWFRQMSEWNPIMKWLYNQVDPQPNITLANRRKMSGTVGPYVPSDNRATGGGVDFGVIERKYGLPAGLLDRMWTKESNRGRAMLSPKGAQGHFGFMPPTAAQYGLKDPNSLAQSADAAGRYMSDLLTRYGGDLPTALAAYNWGLGNVDKYGLGAAPAETRDYMKMAEGLSFQGPQTTIIIQGAQDPATIADQVESSQERINADYVRHLGTVLQ